MRQLLACSLILLATTISAQGLGVAGGLARMSDGTALFQVSSVAPGGLAARLGIVPGDLIHSINGLPPGNAATNQQAIARGGGKLSLVVTRAGRRMVLGDPVPSNSLPRPGQISIPGIGGINFPFGIDPDWGQIPTKPNPVSPGGGFIPSQPATSALNLVPGTRGPALQMNVIENIGLGGNQVVVEWVTAGGIGDRLGFRAGDIITSVNGLPVTSRNQLISNYIVPQNRTITFGVLRGGRAGTITLNSHALRGGRSNPGVGPRSPSRPQPSPIITELGFSYYRNSRGEIVVQNVVGGLGVRLGLTRGMRVESVNGRKVNSVHALKDFEKQLLAGQVTAVTMTVLMGNDARRVLQAR